MFDLKGKVAVVTGKGGNLGPIWSTTLILAGADTWGLDLPDVDVTDKESIQKFKQVMNEHDCYPSIIINNAAIDNPPGSGVSFWTNAAKIVETNLIGAANVAEAFIPDMIEGGGGVIVNVGSIMGNIGADWRNYPEGFEKPVGYNLSKAGLVQLSRSITTQYGRYNIRSVTIAFGPFDGGQLPEDFKGKFLKNVPLGRTISEESLKTTLLYAVCCPELAGQQILVDGGYCIL